MVLTESYLFGIGSSSLTASSTQSSNICSTRKFNTSTAWNTSSFNRNDTVNRLSCVREQVYWNSQICNYASIWTFAFKRLALFHCLDETGMSSWMLSKEYMNLRLEEAVAKPHNPGKLNRAFSMLLLIFSVISVSFCSPLVTDHLYDRWGRGN